MIGTFYKAKFLALNILFAFFALGTLFAQPLFASEIIVERPENELLILELRVNGKLRDRTFLGYLPISAGPNTDLALLPIGALAKKLSYAIDVDTAAGIARGWFINEDNTFQLNLERKIVLIDGQERSIPDGVAEAHYEDIYVQAEYLEDWFKVKIDTDTSVMRVFVASDEMLPFEKEIERQERAEELTKRERNIPDHSSAKLIPYKTFSLPSIVLQTSSTLIHNSEGADAIGSYSIQTNGDLFNFGTRFVASGSVDKDNGHSLQAAQLTFNRQDPGRNLLGPLRAGSVSFGDVSFPDVPLAISRRRGRGVAVSSDSSIVNSTVFTPELTIIEGDAPIGWDAELYRNGAFIAFLEIGNDGRYTFEDVELIRGFNLFEIVLYGPEGQKRTQSQRIVRGARMLREGETHYDFALGQPAEDFIPLVDNPSSDSAFGTSGQFFYGLKKYLTVGASIFSGKDVTSTLEDTQTAGTVSAITSFLGFRTQIQLMQATEGRSGYDIETTTRFKGTNLTIGHTEFDGFNNDDRRLKKRTSLNANRKFGPISANARIEKLAFVENDDEFIIDTTISTKVKGVDITNQLERTISDNDGQDDFDGELATAFNIKDWRVRSSLDYTLNPRAEDRLESFRISGLKRFSQDHSLRLNGTHIFSSNLLRADMRYTRQIEDVSLDFNLSGDNEENYSAGIALRTALQPDTYGDYNFVNVRDGNLGSVGLRAFVDVNGNKVYDEGEALLKGIEFRSNRGLIEDLTDERGTVFVRGLSQSVTRFSIEESSLPSIYLKPAVDFVDAIPRTGTTATIDLAFTQLGEIDGFVYAHEKTDEGKEKPVAGMEIRLVDTISGEEVENTRSEYDGYYVFSAIPLSSYRVDVIPSWGDGDNLLSQTVTLDVENSVLLNVNLTLPPRSDTFENAADLSSEVSIVEPAAGEASLPKSKSGYFAQLGSMTVLGNANQHAVKLRADYDGLLGDDNLEIRRAIVGGVTYHRVLKFVDSKKAAKKLCKALRKDGLSSGCNVVKM